MNDPRRLIILMWFVALGLVAAREIRTSKTLPAPSAMVKGSIVYSILAVVGEFAGPFAAALAVGYTIALLMVPGLLPTPPPAQPGLVGSNAQTGPKVIAGQPQGAA